MSRERWAWILGLLAFLAIYAFCAPDRARGDSEDRGKGKYHRYRLRTPQTSLRGIVAWQDRHGRCLHRCHRYSGLQWVEVSGLEIRCVCHQNTIVYDTWMPWDYEPVGARVP